MPFTIRTNIQNWLTLDIYTPIPIIGQDLWWRIEYAKSPNLKKKCTFGEKDPQKLA